ncbi:MAG: ABC transporter permease, partial [Phaeodactylibacter sp.]|nr:ABC transporter permease [Phaeodactylibacter sp.]
MFPNYLKIAIRHIRQNGHISLINIAGLAIGIATCLVIMLFVQHELSFDRYNEKAGRIVRVTFNADIQGEKINEATVMPPVAQTLKTAFPEVEDATRLRYIGKPLLEMNGEMYRDVAVSYADANVFDVFTFPLLEGRAASALSQPHTAVISEAIAERFFGKQPAIGKTLTFIGWDTPYQVTGVMKNIPETSHFHLDILASMAGLPEAQSPTWMNSNFYTYLLLAKGADHRQLEGKLPAIIEKHLGPQLKEGLGMSFEDFTSKGNRLALKLQPLTDIYLHSPQGLSSEFSASGDARYVYIFGAIALFMLLIACINFMNLSTAGASKRAKEVGVRKVVGSGKGELIRQFLTESVLLALVSLAIGLVLAELALPFFNQIAEKKLHFDYFATPWLLPALLLFGVFTGIVAGSYPAFFLSAFKPQTVLKGQADMGRKSLGLRNGLVVFQFILSITLMACTAVVWKQLHFIQNAKLGYDHEAVLAVPNLWALGENEPAFRQHIAQDRRVRSVSYSGYIPAGESWSNNMFFAPGHDPTQTIKTLRYDVDEQYIPTLGMKLAEGRNFMPGQASDSSAIIVNQAAVKAFGWADGAIGHTVTTSFKKDESRKQYSVIGVVQDFHFKSFHERISPLVMVLGPNNGAALMKVDLAEVPGLLASLGSAWKNAAAEQAFDYSFLDERIYNTYQSERRTGAALGLFAGLTVFVACLGLLGLAIFAASQRTKEIGIRKILGATTTSIVSLLSKDFLKLVLIALAIACPLAYYFMDK